MSKINLKLQGQFKFDLYTPQGELIKSSEYIDNFITNSGVLYPYHFAFADCFRFLSIGTGTGANAITSPATTGLQYPLSQYSSIGSRAYWDSGAATSFYAQPGNFGAGCGYVNNPNGVSLIRQWNLPDNTGGVFSNSGVFNEFMVSPGRSYVTGFGGAKFCSCNDFDSYATGLDCSSTVEYYEWLTGQYLTINHQSRLIPCDATAAFARVIYPLTYSGQSILTVTYKLDIIVNTGITYTGMNFKRSDSSANWNYKLAVVNSITQPGVMLINNGTIYNSVAPNGSTRLQHFDYDPSQSRLYSFTNEYGESFVPPGGAPLEPSNLFIANQSYNQNISVYVSTDNKQFLVNSEGGRFTNSGNYAPWNVWTTSSFANIYAFGNIVSSGGNSYQYIYPNPSSGNFLTNPTYWQNIGGLNVVVPFSSGVLPFSNDNDDAIISGTSYWSSSPNLFNIRTNSGTMPSDDDITVGISTSGNTFYSEFASLPTFILNYIGNNANNGTRNAQVNYSYSFQNYNVSNQLPVKSMVFGYVDPAFGQSFGQGDTVNVVPFFDVVFSGVSGNADNAFLPLLISGDDLDPIGTGVQIQEFSNVDYNYLDGTTSSAPYPIFNTSLSWNVPCPPGTVGC